MEEQGREPMTFKFDPGTRKMIELCAEAEQRNMTNYIEVLVKRDAEAKGIIKAKRTNGKAK